MGTSPTARHRSTPAEIQDRIAAERLGRPFLIYRDRDDRQVIVELPEQAARLTIGRREDSDVQLDGDPKVSRLHAELERVGDDWTLVDDGLSHNGSYLNDARVVGRRRLTDGDVMTFGHTAVVFRNPAQQHVADVTAPDTSRPLHVHLTPVDRQVLASLCSPLLHSPYAAPAGNREIAGELHMSIQAVKARLHGLFQRFEVDHLPQNQKRVALAAAALRAGMVMPQDRG